jgi:hypothetical protein
LRYGGIPAISIPTTLEWYMGKIFKMEKPCLAGPSLAKDL